MSELLEVIKISKKVIYTKHLRKGTFHIHGDKNGGHPALIVEKNDKKNSYKLLKFTHQARADRTKLNRNIDPIDKRNTYVLNNPIYSKRNKLSKNELSSLSIDSSEKIIIKIIKRKQ
ncbi:MAG: hypothetical protein K6G28_00300 [Acholeplasmatales bacterium]|nr:hypothetical protein [Acholeplasmatales bacterium]